MFHCRMELRNAANSVVVMVICAAVASLSCLLCMFQPVRMRVIMWSCSCRFVHEYTSFLINFWWSLKINFVGPRRIKQLVWTLFRCYFV